MATPAAVLSILVQAHGIAQTKRDLDRLDADARRAAKATENLDRKFTSLDRSVGDFNRVMTGTRNAISLVKFPSIIAGAGMAAQAMGAAGAGGVALASALGPLAGLGAAAGVGLTAAAQGAGVFALASMGIGDALKEQIDLHTKVAGAASKGAAQEASAAKAIEAAQEGVRSAKEGVRKASLAVADALRDETRASEALWRAQDAEQEAQRALTRARSDAKRELEDMVNSLGDAVRSEEHASIGLEEARARLAEVMSDPTATELERRKAILGVADAEDALKDAQRDRARQEVDTSTAVKAGIDNSDRVVDAMKAVTDAQQAVVDAQRGVRESERATAESRRDLIEAQRDVVKATKAVADAQRDAASGSAGAGAALSNLSKKFNDLPAPAQEFVRTLISLKPRFDELREVSAAGLFPGLTDGLKSAMKNFRAVRGVVAGTAQAMGDLGRKAGELVGSKGFGRDLTTIGERNTLILTRLGNAAISMGDAFRHIAVAAGPLTTWLAKVTESLAANIASAAEAGRESGRLAAFFQRTRQVATTLGHIFRDLAAGLLNIGHAATPLGTDLLGKFEDLMARFREWTGSVKGQTALRDYFDKAREPILQTVGLIGDIGKALIHISQGKGATSLIAKMRELVPIMEDVIVNTTAAFGPALIDSLGNVLRLFGQLAGSNGPLIGMVRLIGLIAGGMADLLAASPELNSMVVTFVGLYGVMKVTTTVFGPLVKMAKALEVALIGQAAATNVATAATLRERAALVATAVAMYASAAATRVATTATTGLAVAVGVLTSPITLVVVGLAALGAGLVVAYKKSETFRNIVDKVWATLKDGFEWVKDHWPLLLAILTGPFGLAVLAIAKHADEIVEFFEKLPRRVVDAIEAGASPIVGVGRWIVNRIIEGLQNMAGAILAAVGWLKNRVVDGIKTYVTGYVDVGRWITNRIADGIRVVTEALASVGGWIKNRVVELVHAAADGFIGAGTWIINRIADGISTVTEALGSVGGWIKNRIVELVHNAADGFVELGSWVVGKFVEGIKAVPKKLLDAAEWLKDKIVDAVKDFLGISSPSKVFAEIGGHMMEGLIKGMSAKDVVGFVTKHLGGLAKIAPKLIEAGLINIATLPIEGLKKLGEAGAGLINSIIGGGGDDAKAVQGQTWPILADAARKAGLTVTSTTGGQHAANSWHYQGRAVDAAGSPDLMMAFARSMLKAAGSLKELFYDPLGVYVKNGAIVAGAIGGHSDHVHVAMERGGYVKQAGWALVGERGPELAHLPSRSTVYPADQSAAMLAESGTDVHVHFHGLAVAPTPQQAYELGRQVTAGLGYQNPRRAPRTRKSL